MSKTKQTDNNTQVSTITNNFHIFDNGPEEPKLCTLRGYDDCENCYFRLTAVKRITDSVQRLQEA